MSNPVTIEDIYKLFQNSQAQDNLRAAEFDRRMAESKAESDRSMAELKRTVDRTSKAVDALTTRWGRFVIANVYVTGEESAQQVSQPDGEDL